MSSATSIQKFLEIRAISGADQHNALMWMIGSCVSRKLTFLRVDSLRFLTPKPCRNCSANRYTLNVVISRFSEMPWVSLNVPSLDNESLAEFWGYNGFKKKAAIAAKARRKASSKNISMASKVFLGLGCSGECQKRNRFFFHILYKVLRWKFAGEAAGVLTFKLRLRGNLQLMAGFCLQSWWLVLLHVFTCVFSHNLSFVLCHFQLHPNWIIVCFCARSMSEGLLLSTVTQCKCRISHFCLECPASCTQPEWLGQKSNGIMILDIFDTNLWKKRIFRAPKLLCPSWKLSSLALCPFLKSFGFHDNLQSQPGRIIVQLGMLLFWLLDALSRLNQVILFLVHVIHVPFK